MFYCITNNPFLIDKHQKSILQIDGETIELLRFTKNKIIEGHKLLTHPLTGNIGPDKTPYKSVIITKEKGEIDLEHLAIIENAIDYTFNLLQNQKPEELDDEILKDYAYIDYDLIKSFFEE